MRGKGISQIIIGLFVSAISFYMNSLNKDSKFTLFLYIGLIFFGYGIIKFGIYFLFFRDKKEEKTKEKKNPKMMHPQEVKQFKNHNSPMDNHHPTIVACHACQTKHYSTANFCQMCGAKIK
ncbi:hypothetical protein C0585_04815 [Candidatus Woesearchaeota archaeon]|nr:MAG: hypothetical protein C0585_04815 [Candidatus Woesearchaeota archaeon]